MKKLTPQELRAIRIQLGLTQAQMARLLLLADGRIVRRWEAGDAEISGPASVALQLLLMMPEPLRRQVVEAAKRRDKSA